MNASRRARWGRCSVGLVVVGLLIVLGPVVGVAFADPVPSPARITPDGETAPVAHVGDAADDPAIWVHPSDPARSLVIGNDKQGALEVYDLSGSRVQRIAGAGFWGNVDVRQGVVIGGHRLDVVAVVRHGLRLYTVRPGTRRLSNITDGTVSAAGEGLCLYRRSSSGALYAFVNTRSGFVRQFRVRDADADGRLGARQVRAWDVGTETEGCVADDAAGKLYISEEDVGIWKYGAKPTDSTTARTKVDSVGPNGHLVPDVEGLTLVQRPDGSGRLIASAQFVANGSQSYFTVYQRQGGNAFVGAFRVVNGTAADGCSRTDGIAAYARNLGPRFPSGLFVCQDNNNTAPEPAGNQNFKLIRLEKAVR